MTLRVGVLGASRVGKSALVYRKHSNIFVTEYEPGIQDFYSTKVTIDNAEHAIDVIDFPPLEKEMKAMTDNSILSIEAFILCFSMDDIETLEFLRQVYDRIKTIKGRDWQAIVIVGNKKDLGSACTVTTEQGSTFASALGLGFRFTETSAKTGEDVGLAFQMVVEEALRVGRGQPRVKRNSRCCVM